jgi:hypothetical protein
MKFKKFRKNSSFFEIFTQLGGEEMQEEIELSTKNDAKRIFGKCESRSRKARFRWLGAKI